MSLVELLIDVVEDVLLYGRTDGRLLDTYDEMTPSLETDQFGPRNGGRRELGIVESCKVSSVAWT